MDSLLYGRLTCRLPQLPKGLRMKDNVRADQKKRSASPAKGRLTKKKASDVRRPFGNVAAIGDSLSGMFEMVAKSGACIVSITAVSVWHRPEEMSVVFHLPEKTSDEEWEHLSNSLTRTFVHILRQPGADGLLMGSITGAIHLSGLTGEALEYFDLYKRELCAPDH